MTAVDSPVAMQGTVRRGTSPVDDFADRLSHPVRHSSSGPFATFFLTVITLGLLPLILWPTGWAGFVDSERHDLLDLASWWRRRVDGKRAAELDKITRRLRRRPMLMVLPWLAVGFNAFAMIALFLQGDSPKRIFELTVLHSTSSHALPIVQFHPPERFDGRPPHLTRETIVVNDIAPAHSPLELNLFGIWVVGLGLGYLCHWYAVRSHTVAVNSLVKWTDGLAREYNFTRVRSEALRVGLNPLWIGLGVFLCCTNAWWGIPLVCAGSLQRRYITRSSPAIRIALAGQARDGFAKVQTHGDHFCTADHCGARLPAAARFCPRCGAAV